MHRTLQITVPSDDSDNLCDELAAVEEVIGLSIARRSSLKPPGDVITAHVLNRGVDEVLKLVRKAADDIDITIATAEAASFIEPKNADFIQSDVDEAIWEEMETGLRHQGRVTSNFIVLMALGGAIAAVGLVSEPSPQAIAFVAASVISPGFEPLAKIPLGLVLRRWKVAERGLWASLVGYAVLIASAALVTFFLLATQTVEVSELLENPEIHKLAQPTLKEMVVSLGGAAAGMIIISAYRRSVIAGALIALIIIPAAASIGAGLAAGEMKIVINGFQRLGIDVLIIFATGLIVFFIKQVFVHRRQPMV